MYRFLAVMQATSVGLHDAKIFIEPFAGHTAPAARTAVLLLAGSPDDFEVIPPLDNDNIDLNAFMYAIEFGKAATEDGALVPFGVTPTRPRGTATCRWLGAQMKSPELQSSRRSQTWRRQETC